MSKRTDQSKRLFFSCSDPNCQIRVYVLTCVYNTRGMLIITIPVLYHNLTGACTKLEF